MSAPDKIWATGGHYWENPTHKRDKTEYIRADLVPQWLPIETAPKDGTEIIIYHQNEGAMVGYYTAFWKTYGEYLSGQSEVTHWQPLPTPPPAT